MWVKNWSTRAFREAHHVVKMVTFMKPTHHFITLTFDNLAGQPRRDHLPKQPAMSSSPTFSDMPTEILIKIYTYLPFGTPPWCKRILRISRLPLVQIDQYITFRSSTVLSNDESVLSARSLARTFSVTDPSAAAALQRFGDRLPTYNWLRDGGWNRKDVHSDPLTHVVIELLLKCQRLDRMDLVQCLCTSDDKVPPVAIDVSTPIGQAIVDEIVQRSPEEVTRAVPSELISFSFSRQDDISVLAVLDRPVFAEETDLTGLCAVQAFYHGRIYAFRELISNPKYRVDREILDIRCRRFNSQYSNSPVSSADIFIYCVENAILSSQNIWHYVAIWNEMPRIASYIAANPNVVPQPRITTVWRMMRLSIGRHAPNVVAQILIDLSANLEELWAEQLLPTIVRCPHIVEDTEAHVWAYLLAGGRLNEIRFKRMLEKIEKAMIREDRNSFRWEAVKYQVNMRIAEIVTKYRMHYRDAGKGTGEDLDKINIEREMWWPTSTRVDVDYW